ncbi:MAG: hypothetical protein ISR78_00015 [Spirochaetia bacterium]|nr:hypothetical protein [Spirochaetia bacterium]
MCRKQKYLIKITSLLIILITLPLSANSFSSNSFAVTYKPYIYSAGYDSSDPQTSFFLQPGNAVSAKYLFSFPEKSFTIYTGVGYLQLLETRVTGLEFAKGFSSFFLDAGISYHLSQNFSLSGFLRMHNSRYVDTKTLFAHIETGIIPNITFVRDIKAKSIHKAAKITFPLTVDLRKDVLYAFSFGVGLEIELSIHHDSPSEEGLL